MNFVQIIVISCSEERKANMQKQFSELNLPFPVKYLEGSTPENSKDFLPTNTFESYNRKLCCTKSHIRAIIESCKNDAPPYTIIMEDDASLHTIDFVPIINKLINIWDDTFITPMISIGWVPWEYFQYPCHGILDKCFDLDSKYKYSYRKVPGTQSYIIKRDWIKQYIKLIDQPTFHLLFNNVQKIIDNPNKIDLGTADFLLPLLLSPVVISPPIVIEYNNISLIDNTIDRENVIWKKVFNNFENEQKLYWSNPIKIIIKDQFNQLVDTNNLEKPEQDLAWKYIKNNDTVLELGARYGSVSCVINTILNNKTNQVVIEPDSRVWDALEQNKLANNCNFNIVKGFISNKKLNLTNLDDCYGGYGSTFIEDNTTLIPSYSLDDIKQKYNLDFNVLVADCEGFLEVFFDENPEFYDKLRLIIFEADYPQKCNYDKIKNTLINKNFKKILEGHQNVFLK